MSRPVRLALLLMMLVTAFAHAGGRTTHDLDFDWRFTRGDVPGAQAPDFDDSGWRLLDLPHDWSIEGEYRQDNPDKGAGAYLPAGVGWYRRTLEVPPEWRERHVRIEFDAAQRNSDVWINGQHLGRRPYGYISFAYDLTPHLRPGRNVIAVRLDNPLPAARWYTGSGIYAHVRLVVCDPARIDQWGTFVTTPTAGAELGEARVATMLVNDRAQPGELRLVTEIVDDSGSAIASDEKPVSLQPGATLTVEQSLQVQAPRLWSDETPNLYKVVQRLYDRDAVIDKTVTTFGFRTVRFDAATGFWLNGKSIKLRGVGIHYDAPPMGVAIPDEVLEDRLRQLKRIGCNAIRTGHTPFPPRFYDLCDRLGLMVMNEAFDGWRKKVEHDYGATAFAEWWKRDLTDFVRRDRNHPCVIMWSIGNETGEKDRLGMTQIIRQLDPTRPTTGGQCLHGVDVAGFNGPGEVPGVLEAFRRDHPEVPIVLTEETHAYQTRGVYRVVSQFRETDATKITPFESYGTVEIFSGGDPQHRSSYDNAPVRITSRQCWKRTRDTPWISGEFRWAGFDYLGEAHWGGRQWPARHWHPGIHDSSGLPKDTAYFYQSQWTAEPMVHLLPHWSHPGLATGTIVPVVAYSNCDEVELFLNGRSLGRQPPRAELLDFLWHVPYEPGEIKALAYRGGGVVATKAFHTAGAPARIRLERQGEELKPDRVDVATVTFGIDDAHEVPVPWAMDRVEFRLEGPARLLGYENGNNLDVTPHRVPHREVFHGLGRGFFQATAEDGPVELVAAGILGARTFEQSATAAMAVQRVALRGALAPASFVIHYTLDGSEPSPSSPVYERPIELAQPGTVRVLVLRDGQPYMSSHTQFARSEAGKVAGPAADAKPRDEQLVGLWREGDRVFRFDAEGRVHRRRDDREIEVATWWYDFPDDVFEEASSTGVGELRWKQSEEVVPLRLSDRRGTKLRVNVNKQQREWVREPQ